MLGQHSTLFKGNIMELLLVIVVGVPIVIGLFYALLAELREKDNDKTVRRCEPLISDCRWTRKKFYDEK